MSIRLIARPVRFAVLRPWTVLLASVVLSGLCVWLAATRLAVTTDIDGLFSASLPWKQAESEHKRLFPQFNDLLVAVIEADSPEAADATAASLQAELARSPLFRGARRPDASPYFDREGLLFLSPEMLSKLLDQTIDAQPFLGQLAVDPSARGLFAALSLVAMGVDRGQADLTGFAPALRAFDAALGSALGTPAGGTPRPLSWQRLLSGPASELGGPYRFVLAQPKLDYGTLSPGGAATAALREAVSRLEFVRSGQARVGVTGSVALSDEEFATVAHGAVAGLIGSTLLVILWLSLAVRSWRLILPILVTLVAGLLLTTGFATLTSSPLNLISVAFAILFVGIAVDFAIQFSVRYREMLGHHPDAGAALMATADRSGGQVMVAALATSAGFLAFVPTDFRGVAELGLIAGVGMLIALACTLTLLPACIMLCSRRGAARAGAAEVGFAWAAPLDRKIAAVRWLVLGGFVALAGLGAAAIPMLQFDSDPLHVKDPNTEAMRVLAGLAANPVTYPYTIDLLAPDAARAAALVAKLQTLPLVAQVVSLASFVPAQQGAKLPLIADAASLLAPTLAPRTPPAPVTPEDLRLAAQTAGAQLARVVPKLPAGHPLAAIAADLRLLAAAPDPVLLSANEALTRFLPMQIARLREALQAAPVDESRVPPEIARDWVLPDGRRRIQVSATTAAGGQAGLRQFVDQVRTVAPDAGGSAVAITETANTIISAFTRAALGALLAIVVILAVVLRRAGDVAMVLAPLLLTVLLTALACVLMPLPLNFANVIALPLLLGVGVSFNIYFVMNWRAGQTRPLQSPTARAVVFSALTTGTAFGSLALSAHPGTASMGVLLLVSLGCTLLASLVFVPAMLAIFRPHGRAID
ncbi:MAG: MMPL family transporter [Janthinobacterium lividum]